MESNFTYWLYSNLLLEKEKLPEAAQKELEVWLIQYDRQNYLVSSEPHLFLCNIFDWPTEEQSFQRHRSRLLQDVLCPLDLLTEAQFREVQKRLFE